MVQRPSQASSGDDDAGEPAPLSDEEIAVLARLLARLNASFRRAVAEPRQAAPGASSSSGAPAPAPKAGAPAAAPSQAAPSQPSAAAGSKRAAEVGAAQASANPVLAAGASGGSGAASAAQPSQPKATAARPRAAPAPQEESWAYAVWAPEEICGVHAGGGRAWRQIEIRLGGPYSYAEGDRLRRYHSVAAAIEGYQLEAAYHEVPHQPVLYHW